MYLIKFVPGFAELVAEQLRKSARIVDIEEDIALFEAPKPPAVPYAAQLYRVLGSYGAKSMAELLRAAANDGRYIAALRGEAQGETFRVRCMQGDQAVKADAAQLLELERGISRAGLSVHRTGPKHELRLWLRGRGKGLFLMKLDQPFGQGKLPPGVLRPDLCHMLCLLARVRGDDRCIDPFCGSGAIPRAMTHYTGNVTASDIDVRAVARAGGIKGVSARVADALSGSLPAGRYSVIITDPPWGLYKQQARADFLGALCASLSRMMAPGGRCVLFLERSMPVERAAESAGLEIARRFDALYSGHKVKALLLTRMAEDDDAR